MIGRGTIGNQREDAEFEMECFKCGSQGHLMTVAHRNRNGFIVGFLFLCNVCLPDIGGKYTVVLQEMK